MGHFVVGVGCYHHNRKTYGKEGKDIELHKGKEKILAGLGLLAVEEGCKENYKRKKYNQQVKDYVDVEYVCLKAKKLKEIMFVGWRMHNFPVGKKFGEYVNG